MATFYYNPSSDEDRVSQWQQYIQTNAYFEDISTSISQQTDTIKGVLRRASREQVAAIERSTSAICGTLESGFELLSDNLQEISYGIGQAKNEINRMASMLDWKLSLLIEQQKITNILSGNIANLLRIPDIQKERQYHIEQGMKFLKNAISNSEYYEDALNNLSKAIEIEPTDYFVLHRIGLIYMYSPKYFDISAAEEYFKKAAKYAFAEVNAGANTTTTYLRGDLNRNLSEQAPTVDELEVQAAESLMFVARCCYIKGKLAEAAEYAGKGFNIAPELTEVGFTQAKALAANNEGMQAALILEKVINTDRFYSLKAITDPDLCLIPEVELLLQKLQKEAYDQATTLLQECRQQIISDSNATKYLAEIERLIHKNTYLDSKKAIDLFGTTVDWKFCEPFTNEEQENYLRVIIEFITKLAALPYNKKDKDAAANHKSVIDSFVEYINQATQWVFPFCQTVLEYSNYSQLTDKINTKQGNYTVDKFIEAEKAYHDYLPNTLVQMQTAFQEYEETRQKDDNENKSVSIKKGLVGIIPGVALGIIATFFWGMMIIHFITKALISSIIGKIIVIVIVCLPVVFGGIWGYRLYYNKHRYKK